MTWVENISKQFWQACTYNASILVCTTRQPPEINQLVLESCECGSDDSGVIGNTFRYKQHIAELKNYTSVVCLRRVSGRG